MPRAGEDNIGYLVNQSARLLTKSLNGRLKEHGLTQGQYAVIRSIDSIRDRPVTATELSDDLRLEPSATAHAVDRAVAHGWVVALPHAEHSRARVLELTPQARSALPVIKDAGHWTLSMGLNGFTREEIGQLKSLLQRLVTNLEADDV